MNLDLLAVGAHPDDVELCAGGTLAKAAAAGRRTGIVHLTRGEAGTRGTVAERRREAEAAAAALGAASLDFLDCGDGDLRTGTAEVDALVEVLRRRRPELVLVPPPADRHPDHGRAHRLAVDACFYAGLRGRAAGRGGEVHRPGAVFHYMQHDLFEPRFIVDVGAHWQRKLAALACYRSQLHQPEVERPEPQTKVSSPSFRAAIEGRARHFGQVIGVDLGEAFGAPGPLAVDDPCTLVPAGLR